jgi:ankyrin repeat protein
MSEAEEGGAIYPHYQGIWRHVDLGDLEKLAQDPDTDTEINEKQQGNTPLFLACLRKNVEMVHLLLQSGADPNIGFDSYFLVISNNF